MALKTQKNLNTNRNEYNAFYGDFRGVDFSNDHTQVHNNRFAYLCNMYKDYKSKQGVAVETVPGYRMGFSAPLETEEIHAIHRLGSFVFVHCGNRLYHWVDYPVSCGVKHSAWVELGDPIDTQLVTGLNTFHIDLLKIANTNGREVKTGATVIGVRYATGEEILNLTDKGGNVFEFSCQCSKGDLVHVTYVESMPKVIKIRKDGSEGAEIVLGVKSLSFSSGDEMLLIDNTYTGHEGGLYAITLRDVDGEKWLDNIEKIATQEEYVHIPLTHALAITEGVNADIGEEQEQLNLATNEFKNSFYGTTNDKQTFKLAIPAVSIVSITVKGTVTIDGNKYKDYIFYPPYGDYISFDDTENTVTLIGTSDEKTVFIVTARKDISGQNHITSCTASCVHDDRIFLAGSFYNPNRIIFSKRIGETNPNGIFPLYFGEKDNVLAGIGGRVSGLASVGKNLVAFKSDAYDEPSVYMFSGFVTGENVVPWSYQKEQGINGIECYGACKNFNDDPVFLTKNGLDALGSVSISYERALQHRSSLVDAKLCSMDLENAFIEEFGNYLAIFANGSVFLADSRQRYTDELGTVQYEWYYLEDVGYYNGQYQGYKYATASEFVADDNDAPLMVSVGDNAYALKLAPEEKRGTIANENGAVVHSSNVTKDSVDIGTASFVIDGENAYECTSENVGFVGGTFCEPKGAKVIGDNLLFYAKNKVFQFNFDKRDENGEIAPEWYTFDGRAILCGCATKMDNCGIPHLTKSTVKRSMVAKTKTMPSSVIKVKVRTNRNPYEQVARLSNVMSTFEDLQFADYSFTESGLFSIREKEKKWVEKQIYLYSDELMRPFSLYYLAYRYVIAGRFKD